MRFYAGVLASILLVGCAIQPDAPAPSFTPAGLRFAVEPQTAAPGATVTLLLINRSPHLVGYNLCGSGLERYDGASWRTLPAADDGASSRALLVPTVCTMELRTVPQGRTATYARTLPTTLSAGEYRFTTVIESPMWKGAPGQALIASEPFRVRP